MNSRKELMLSGTGLRLTPSYRVHIALGAHNLSPAFRRQN